MDAIGESVQCTLHPTVQRLASQLEACSSAECLIEISATWGAVLTVLRTAELHASTDLCCRQLRSACVTTSCVRNASYRSTTRSFIRSISHTRGGYTCPAQRDMVASQLPLRPSHCTCCAGSYRHRVIAEDTIRRWLIQGNFQLRLAGMRRVLSHAA